MQNVQYNRDLVLVGGGHAHCIALRMLAMKPIPGVRITLISPDPFTPYSGMLPGLVAGHYNFEDVHIDLDKLACWAGVRFIQARVIGLDADKKLLRLDDDRPPLGYDALSLDIGSVPDDRGIEGVREYAVPVKPVANFYQRWQKLDQCVNSEATQRYVVVGGGAGSVELILAMHYRLVSQTKNRSVQLTLLTAGEQILPDYGQSARRKVLKALQSRQINIHTNFRVARLSESTLYSTQEETLAANKVFWCTAATAALWLKSSELSCDAKGFVTVNDSLQSTSHPAVFAAGDIASQQNYPRPKAGVFAVRQGPFLAENLRPVLYRGNVKSLPPPAGFFINFSFGR